MFPVSPQHPDLTLGLERERMKRRMDEEEDSSDVKKVSIVKRCMLNNDLNQHSMYVCCTFDSGSFLGDKISNSNEGQYENKRLMKPPR